MIDPKHYEGWSCEDCEYLETIELNYPIYRCKSMDITDDYTKRNPYIGRSLETPQWCPFIKDAIINRVVEES